MKLKKLFHACSVSIMLAATVPAYALVAVDPPSLAQQIINYLQIIQQYQNDMMQTYNQIEQLRRMEIPSIAQLTVLNQLKGKYIDMVNAYNENVASYNNLNASYIQFQELDEELTKCTTERLCSKEEINEVKDKRLKAIKSIADKMHDSRERSQKLMNSLSEKTNQIEQLGVDATNQGQVDAAQLIATKMLLKQIIEMREDFARTRYEDLEINLTQEKVDRASEIQSLKPLAK